MDAKIVVASAAAVIFISGFFLAGSGGGNLLDDIINGLGNLMHNAPFEGFFVSQEKAPKLRVAIEIYSQNISLRPDRPVNITWDGQYINGFSGTISLDYESKVVRLVDSSEAGLALKRYNIEGLSLGALELSPAGYDINGQVKSKNGSISIKSFVGQAVVEEDRLVLSGNATFVKAVADGQVWELK